MNKTIYLFFIILIVLCSCTMNNQEEIDENNDNPIIIPEELIKWETDDYGYMQFYTNDKLLKLLRGCTFWKPDVYPDLTDDIFEVELNKISGKEAYGYGIIFCIQETPGIDSFAAKNFYSLLIRCDGYYKIIKVVDRKQHDMILPESDQNNWVMPKDIDDNYILNIGKNQINKIRLVTKDTDNDNYPDFTIYFNDIEIYQFEEDFSDDNGEILPLFEYNQGLDKYGFIVTIGPDENFPTNPVDVRYKQIIQ